MPPSSIRPRAFFIRVVDLAGDRVSFTPRSGRGGEFLDATIAFDDEEKQLAYRCRCTPPRGRGNRGRAAREKASIMPDDADPITDNGVRDVMAYMIRTIK